MRSTGITRRICLPKEILNFCNIKNGDCLQLLIDGDKMIFEKIDRRKRRNNLA